MSIIENVPDGARRFVSALFSGRSGSAAGETASRRWRSLVTRDPGLVIWFRRAVLRRKPLLYHFEVQLTDHCNLDCRGCAHFSNLCTPTFADLAEFDADMERMASIFSKVREIHLLGGEPLLHPKVTEFCAAARRHFPRSRICLVTNGTMVMRMNEQFWSSLAENRIVLLCRSLPINVPKVEIDLIGKQRHVKVEWTKLDEDLVKIPIDPRGGHEADASFRRCQGYNNRPLLRHGRLYPCASIAFADVFRARFGVNGLQVYPTDWIGIRDEPDPEQVFAFLRNPVHWCSNCDVDNRGSYEWGRSDHHVSEWTGVPGPLPRPPQG